MRWWLGGRIHKFGSINEGNGPWCPGHPHLDRMEFTEFLHAERWDIDIHLKEPTLKHS